MPEMPEGEVMKNVHNGKGNINVTSDGRGSDLIVVAGIAVGAYFLMGVIIHLLMLLIIFVGVLAVATGAGLAIWHFYIVPRLPSNREYRRMQYLDRKYPDTELESEFPPAIENTTILLTPQQYEMLMRKYRDES
jgi:hypothetical protein